MKAKERLDKVLEAVHAKIIDEVGGLIGVEMSLTQKPGELVSKGDLFEQPLGKQVFAKMDVVGDIEGKGGLLISVKDAIRLGGTLIMLPPSELEEIMADENYDGETEDSYGEIANIIAGSYTKTFEEMYPKACRFIRKEQQVLIPIKVDIESDEPCPDGMYYQVSATIQLEEKQLGDLTMLIPAEAFGLVEAKQEDAPAEHKDASTSEQAAPEGEAASSPEKSPEATVEEDTVADVAEEAAAEPAETAPEQEEVVSGNEGMEQKEVAEARPGKEDTEKHRKRVDSLLEVCRTKVEEEVGALLGVEVSCSGMQNKIVNKEEFFFDEASGKQVVAYMDAVGEIEDKSYLFIGLKDAIRIGSTLIMLPPNELESAVSEEDFGEDSKDAYGEIANIIAGVYTAVFEEQYVESIRFIKKDIEQIVPMKVDIESDKPIPDQLYYMTSVQFAMEGKEYGKLQLLFPAAMLRLESLGIKEEPAAPEKSSPEKITEITQKGKESEKGAAIAGPASSTPMPDADILIVSDSGHDAGKIIEVLEEKGYTHTLISFRDNVHGCLPGVYKAVFLVTGKVDEQAFGLAIKISTACKLPLIATGSEWTRTKVIKAVKYGVSDILLTPAEKEDIEEKLNNNVVKMAA